MFRQAPEAVTSARRWDRFRVARRDWAMVERSTPAIDGSPQAFDRVLSAGCALVTL